MPSVLDPFAGSSSVRRSLTPATQSSTTLGPCKTSGYEKNNSITTTNVVAASNSRNLISLFKTAALKHPDTIAVDDAGGSLQLTYHELDILSSRLARHIADRLHVNTTPTSNSSGSSPAPVETVPVPAPVIPILTSLSASAVVGILAILKAGAAYVPIDCTQWSREHIAAVLETLGGKMLVYSDEFFSHTQTTTALIDPDLYGVKIPISQCGLQVQTPFPARVDIDIDIGDDDLPAGLIPRLKDLPLAMTPETTTQGTLACVIFTSGTTGKPKGVMIRHESLANYAICAKSHINPDPVGARSFLGLSISFDACNGYLFTYLVNGCTTVIANWNDATSNSNSSYQDRFATCSFAVLTPSVLASLDKPGTSSAYTNLKRMVLGGETPSQDLLSSWLQPLNVNCQWTIYNVYGPTEATVGVLVAPFQYDEILGRWETCLLGRPIPGVYVKIWDDDTGREIIYRDRPESEHGDEGIEDEEGEILIGGDVCLAIGYWRNQEKTAERFINFNGERFYRTGDRGRWWRGDEQRIIFLGREDRTVKNRGFLVNLETEVDGAVLGSNFGFGLEFGLSGAFTVMVTPVEEQHQQHKMMCMLVSPRGVDVHCLRSRMMERLPAYQVPDWIVAVETLPIGRTGKVDPNAVRDVFLQSMSRSQPDVDMCPSSSLPRHDHQDESEGVTTILSIISEILGLPRSSVLLPLDVENSFMGLGGHSLAAVSLSGRFRRQLGASIQPRDILLSGTIRELVAMVIQARQQNSKEEEPNSRSEVLAASGVESLEEEARITRTQRELLYASENTPGASMIRLYFTFPTDQIPSLKQAWKAVLESESIFKIRFDLTRNRQAVGEKTIPFLWEETTLLEDQDIDNNAGEHLDHHAGTSFQVFHSSSHGGKSRLIWTIHHALIDGYAACLLLRKLGTALSGNLEHVPRGPSFCRVLNDISPSQGQEEPVSLGAALAFRRQQRAEVPDPVGKLELFPRPPAPPNTSETRPLENNVIKCGFGMSVESLEQLALGFNVTPITLFYVAWAILLSRYTGSTQVIFGVVLSGREVHVAGVRDIETVIGPLISTAQLRVLVDPGTSIATLAAKVFSDLHSLIQYQWIVQGVEDEDVEDSDEVIHTAVVSQRGFPVHPFQDELDDVVAVTTVPVSLLVQEDWSFGINYRTDLYTEAQMDRLAENFNNVLCSMMRGRAPVALCLQDALMPDQEKKLLEFGNVFSKDTMVDDSEGAETLLDMFERTVRDHGDLVAVEKDDQRLTYKELDAASTKVARRMITQHGITPGTEQVVALHVSSAARPVNWIIGIFAIMKAGAVYCSLDGDLPPDMRRDLFKRAGADLFLTCTRGEFDFVPVSGANCLAVEEALLDPEGQIDYPSLPPLWADRDPHTLLYICFTSGSIGKPKGVAVKHGSVVAMQKHLASRLHAKPGLRIMQFLAVGFDGSIMEILSALCHGATLVLRPGASEGKDLFSVLRSVDVAIVTPSTIEGLNPDDFPRPKFLYFGGEPLSQSTVDLWAPGRCLFNYYGPTEVTMGSVLNTECLPSKPVTIGKPLPSVRAYVLDENQQLVPQGCTGEIVLAGVQVARGYIGMPDETLAKFLPDTILSVSDSGRTHERMYRTGDMGYWTEEGELVCLDRRDRLVKIRGGFRVSLGNVEEVLCSLPRVTRAAAAVTVQKGATNAGSVLLAWVTPGGSVDIDQLRHDLASRLPVYARPQHIIALDSFPLTRNGKVDYRTLLQSIRDICPLTQNSTTGAESVQLTQTEVAIAKVWRSLLDLDKERPLFPSDNFLSLGGHSIRQLSLASRLSTTFGCTVPVRQVLKCETLDELGRAVDQLKAEKDQQSETLSKQQQKTDEYDPNSNNNRQLGRVELSPVEYEWWLKYQAASPAAAASFSVIWSCSLDPNKVDVHKLARAWSDVITRHEILSSRFRTDEKTGIPYRILSSTAPQPLLILDGDDDEIDIAKETNKSFNLSNAHEDLIRVKISRSRLLLVISHILCDLTTLRILLREASLRYRELAMKPSLCRPLPKSQSYFETSFWFEEPKPEDLAFWSRYLKGAPKALPDLKSSRDFSGKSQTFSFPPEIFTKINEFNTRNSASLYQTLLLGTALTLQALTSSSQTSESQDMDTCTSSIILGTPFINRPTELELNSAGLFLQPLPFRLTLNPKQEIPHLLAQTKSSLQDILSHAIPWSKLLSHLGLEPPRDSSSYPLFDTVVSLHDYTATGMEPLILDLAIDGVGAGAVPAAEQQHMQSGVYNSPSGSKFKLMFEYTLSRDSSLSLRMEYATPRVEPEMVDTLYKGLLGCFGCLSSSMGSVNVKSLRDAVVEASGGLTIVGL